jgi:superfamily II DNA/RNA helicase
MVLEGSDLRASAQTGTGKTAAFILPALQLLTTPSALPGRGPRVLILVPTRELALQVSAKAEVYSKHLPRCRTVCIYGGAPYPVQNRELSRPVEILVATPGRLIDHMNRGRVDFSRLEMLVLDEADRMLDMGFIGPVEEIAAATPSSRQTLLFSATLKGNVMKLSQKLLRDPKEISIQAERTKHENIDQKLFFVDNMNHKLLLLEHLLKQDEVKQAIVFSATKRHADELVDILREQGLQADALHGDMNQRQRTRTMTQMRAGKVTILVATDVAARGLDVSTVSHVINFDLPQVAEDYVHRIGRTGRAGANGIAYSFVSSRDAHLLRAIEQYTGHKMTPETVPGLEPKTRLSFSSAPPPRRTFGKRPAGPNAGPNNRFQGRGGSGYPARSSANPRSSSSFPPKRPRTQPR